MIFSTRHGAHTRLVNCHYHGEDKNLKRELTFMPNLFDAVSSMVIAEDSKSFVHSILYPMTNDLIPDLNKHMKLHGSMQQSFMSHMGRQELDE